MKRIIQYVRDENRKPYGAVVAIAPGQVGWSLCNPKDKWNRKKAIDMATARAFRAEAHDEMIDLVRSVRYSEDRAKETLLIMYKVMNRSYRTEW